MNVLIDQVKNLSCKHYRANILTVHGKMLLNEEDSVLSSKFDSVTFFVRIYVELNIQS